MVCRVNREPELQKRLEESANRLKISIKEAEDLISQGVATDYARSTRILEGMSAWVNSDRLKLITEGLKSPNVGHSLASWTMRWNRSVGRALQETELVTAQYIGSMFASNPEGYHGTIRRPKDAAVVKDLNHRELASQWVPEYRKIMKEYAGAEGKSLLQEIQIAERSSEQHKFVKETSKAVWEHLNKTNLGRVSDANEFVIKLANLVTDTRKRSFDMLAKHGAVTGRMNEHKVDLDWKNLEGAEEILRKGYESAGNKPEVVAKLVNRVINNGHYEAFSLGSEQIDLDVEVGGKTLYDYLNMDVASSLDKHVRKAAALSALSETTAGTIRSGADVMMLERMLENEWANSTEKYKILKLGKDMLNLLFDRPVRGGVSHEMRNVMNIATLSYMGHLGQAQLADAGQSMVRSLYHMGDAEFVKKAVKLAGMEGNENFLVKELNTIVNLWGPIEDSMMHSRFIGESEFDNASELRKLSYFVSDMVTMGNLKVEAMRGLGKITGANTIRKFESRLAQTSYTLDVARYFRGEKSSLSVERLADHGLVRPDGIDKGIQDVFTRIVQYDSDGLVEMMHFNKWPERELRMFQIAMNRNEAEVVQRTLAGEQSTWMNPILGQVIKEFKEMSFVASNKQTLRQIGFADTEAMTALAMNTMIAGLTRFTHFKIAAAATAAVSGRDMLGAVMQDTSIDELNIHKYDLTLGATGDVMHITGELYKGNFLQLRRDVAAESWLENAVKLKDGKTADKLKTASELMIYGNTELIRLLREGLNAKRTD